MITKGILRLVNTKLKAVIYYLIIIGLLFFILAVSVLFYPQILQFVFVLSFFAISFFAFLIAVKIHNIKDNFERLVSFIPKKRKTKKK
jgi:hypothetical protein